MKTRGLAERMKRGATMKKSMYSELVSILEGEGIEDEEIKNRITNFLILENRKTMELILRKEKKEKKYVKEIIIAIILFWATKSAGFITDTLKKNLQTTIRQKDLLKYLTAEDINKSQIGLLSLEQLDIIQEKRRIKHLKKLTKAQAGTIASTESDRVVEESRYVSAYVDGQKKSKKPLASTAEIKEAMLYGTKVESAVRAVWNCSFINSRETHKAAHRQLQDLFRFFLVGGENLRYPRDPLGSPGNIINCKCYLTFA